MKKIMPVVILGLLCLSVFSAISKAESTSTSWLPGWTYRKSHTIDQASGAGTDYQVAIKVYRSTGIDGTEKLDDGTYAGKVYVGTNCRDDFGDIRFTASDGITLLSYWIEHQVNGSYAVFWVKVTDNLSNSHATIYMYYGKSDATTTKNIDNTFIFGDDFETDLSKWTLQGGGAQLSTDHAYEGAKGVKINTGSSWIVRSLSTTSNIAAQIRYYDLMSPNREKHVFETNTLLAPGTMLFDVGVDEDISANDYVLRIGGTYYDTGIARTMGWHSFVVRNNGSVTSGLIDGTLLSQTLAINALASVAAGSWWVANGEYSYYDACFVRKFVNPEPIHGGWGSEEAVAALPVGGYSIPIQAPATANTLTPYIILTTTLATAFTAINRKTKRTK
jgi:hypothetical protein